MGEVFECASEAGLACGNYLIHQTLLEACRKAGDVLEAHRMQQLIEENQLSTALAPLASASIAGIAKVFEKVFDSQAQDDVSTRFVNELRRRTGYTPEVRAIPFGTYCSATRAQQHAFLREHPDKQALIALFCHDQQTDESKLRVAQMLEVTINIKSCEDCHSFFTAASATYCRLLVLRERERVAHEIDKGRCSCREIRNCESRRFDK